MDLQFVRSWWRGDKLLRQDDCNREMAPGDVPRLKTGIAIVREISKDGPGVHSQWLVRLQHAESAAVSTLRKVMVDKGCSGGEPGPHRRLCLTACDGSLRAGRPRGTPAATRAMKGTT